MSIKYELHSIHNAQGTGEERQFARIFENGPMPADDLEDSIQTSCALTKGDVKGALSALKEVMIRELIQGNRFHIPSIGYFSLSVETDLPDGKTPDKMRGDYIRVKNIKFRPEASLLQQVKNNVRFERATFTTKSKLHTEETMVEKINEYLSTNGYLNRQRMQEIFRLRRTAAQKWLKHFTETGVLRKEGTRHFPIYFLNNK